jgi:hypothetical protein
VSGYEYLTDGQAGGKVNLNLTVAAACMARGLTADEANLVLDLLDGLPLPEDPKAAFLDLDRAINRVLDHRRGGDTDA